MANLFLFVLSISIYCVSVSSIPESCKSIIIKQPLTSNDDFDPTIDCWLEIEPFPGFSDASRFGAIQFSVYHFRPKSWGSLLKGPDSDSIAMKLDFRTENFTLLHSRTILIQDRLHVPKSIRLTSDILQRMLLSRLDNTATFESTLDSANCGPGEWVESVASIVVAADIAKYAAKLNVNVFSSDSNYADASAFSHSHSSTSGRFGGFKNLRSPEATFDLSISGGKLMHEFTLLESTLPALIDPSLLSTFVSAKSIDDYPLFMLSMPSRLDHRYEIDQNLIIDNSKVLSSGIWKSKLEGFSVSFGQFVHAWKWFSRDNPALSVSLVRHDSANATKVYPLTTISCTPGNLHATTTTSSSTTPDSLQNIKSQPDVYSKDHSARSHLQDLASWLTPPILSSTSIHSVRNSNRIIAASDILPLRLFVDFKFYPNAKESSIKRCRNLRVNGPYLNYSMIMEISANSKLHDLAPGWYSIRFVNRHSTLLYDAVDREVISAAFYIDDSLKGNDNDIHLDFDASRQTDNIHIDDTLASADFSNTLNHMESAPDERNFPFIDYLESQDAEVDLSNGFSETEPTRFIDAGDMDVGVDAHVLGIDRIDPHDMDVGVDAHVLGIDRIDPHDMDVGVDANVLDIELIDSHEMEYSSFTSDLPVDEQNHNSIYHFNLVAAFGSAVRYGLGSGIYLVRSGVGNFVGGVVYIVGGVGHVAGNAVVGLGHAVRNVLGGVVNPSRRRLQ